VIDFCAGAAQLDAPSFAVADNRRAAVAAVSAAADRGAQLVVLPELVSSGYPGPAEPEAMRRFWDCAEAVPGPFTEALAAVAAERNVYVIAGMLERHATLAGGMWNTVVVVSPDGRVERQSKLHLPREEKRYFFAGDRLQPFQTPLGCLGVLVCADNSFPEAMRALALQGAEVVCVVYAARRTANPETYRWLVATRAYENQLYVIAANRIGPAQDGIFGGRSTIAAPDGSVLDTLDEQEGVAIGQLRADLLLAERLRQSRYRDRRPELYAPLASQAS